MSVDLRDIVKAYGKTVVLRGVSAAFQEGRVCALVGANGAGKTTLLRIIAGLQFADSGIIASSPPLYFGGGETLPVSGTINSFRRAFGLPPSEGGERKLKHLSRGQLHSVGLDIAFGLQPRALLLDEPWSSLEPHARFELNVRVKEYAQAGNAIICSSHELDEVARVADDVAFLRGGLLSVLRREDLGGEFFNHAMLLAHYREGM